MPAHAERIDFAPPPQKGMGRALAIALGAHALLLAALTWGVHWKRSAENVAVEAELWSNTVMQAAPAPVVAPPPPPPTTARVQEAPPPPQNRNAEIAVERERKQREEARREREQQEVERKRQAEKAAREKQAAAQKAADQRKQDEARRREEQQQQAANAKRRDDNIRRMQAMAGASGAPDATGNAMQSSGPSAGYASRLAALFKRNISFPNPDAISGNPKAVVEVRVSPAGLIVGSRLVKSSGVPAWDEAVLRAVEKTERIPADNGRFVPVFPVEFGPKD